MVHHFLCILAPSVICHCFFLHYFSINVEGCGGVVSDAIVVTVVKIAWLRIVSPLGAYPNKVNLVFDGHFIGYCNTVEVSGGTNLFLLMIGKVDARTSNQGLFGWLLSLWLFG